MNTKISVIIPVYNVEKYLDKSLTSVINQTLKDIEIICINDGSTDNSLDILEKYKNNHSNFVIINQKNKGQGSARNAAMEIAKGKYIIFLDPDDWFISNNDLENMCNLAENNSADIVLANYIEYHEKDKQEYKKNIAEELKEIDNFELKNLGSYTLVDLKYDVIKRCCAQTWPKLYKKEFLKQSNIKFACGRFGEDHYFRIQTHIKANRIYYLEDYIYAYRIREDSCCHKITKDAFDFLDSLKATEQFLKENIEIKKYHQDIKSYRINVFASILEHISPKDRKIFEKKMWNYLKNPEEYEKYRCKFGLHIHDSFFEKIFSIKTEYTNNKKRKLITILGLKIKIKKSSLREE